MDIIFKTSTIRFKHGEKPGWLRPLGPKEKYGSKLPGFSFLSHYPRLGTGGVGNLRMPIGTKPKKILLLSQRTRKRATIMALLQPKPQRKLRLGFSRNISKGQMTVTWTVIRPRMQNLNLNTR